MKPRKLLFFKPDDGGGPGAAAFDEPTEEGGPVEGAVPDEGTLPEPVVPSAPAAFDPNAFAQTFAKEVAAAMPKPAPAAPTTPPLTEAEARKKLNFFEFTPEFFTQFDNLETRQKAFEVFRDGLIRNAVTIQQSMLEDLKEEIKTQYGPVVERIERYEAEQREGRFHTAYPALAKKELRPLLVAVAQSMVQQGKKYDSEEEQFKAIAQGAEAVIKVTSPEFNLGTAPVVKPKHKNNGIPTTTPGAGGVGGGSSTGPPKKLGISVFDP